MWGQTQASGRGGGEAWAVGIRRTKSTVLPCLCFVPTILATVFSRRSKTSTELRKMI